MQYPFLPENKAKFATIIVYFKPSIDTTLNNFCNNTTD